MKRFKMRYILAQMKRVKMRYILACISTYSLLAIHVYSLSHNGWNKRILTLEDLIPFTIAVLCGAIALLIGVPSFFFRQRGTQPVILGRETIHVQAPVGANDIPAGIDLVDTVTSSRSTPPSIEQTARESKRMLYDLKLETRFFSLPKEGYDLERCADKFDERYMETEYRAAVADGVSASFLPAAWAQIVATGYVGEGFSDPYTFVQWLNDCSAKWLKWVEIEWIPQANELRGIQQGPEYWQHEIERGAQTTLIGCSFSLPDLLTKPETVVHVDAIGDAEFFLVRPPAEEQDKWIYQAFALKSPEQFGPNPDTLPTNVQYIQDTWQYVRTKEYVAQPGDYILLTTDALAEWILLSLSQGENPWQVLLTLRDEQAFRTFVEQKRASGEIHIDDTTMLVVQLKERPTQQGNQFVRLPRQ